MEQEEGKSIIPLGELVKSPTSREGGNPHPDGSEIGDATMRIPDLNLSEKPEGVIATSPGKIEKNEEDTPLEIMDLPDEVWGNIFKWLSQNEVLNLRLVCSPWLYEIDEYYEGWVIKIDDSNDDWESLLNLRAKEYHIIKMLKPLKIGYEIPMKHPELITKFTIVQDDLYGFSEIITPYYLDQFLRLCQKNVKEIQLGLTPSMVHGVFMDDLDQGYRFENLYILIIRFQFQPIPVNIPPENLLREIFVKSSMPKLKILNYNLGWLKFSNAFANQLSFDILSFLARLGNQLEELLFWFDVTSTPATLQPNKVELAELKKANCLAKLFVNLNETIPWSDREAWTTLMANQTKLISLHVKKCPISDAVCREIGAKNARTLRSISFSMVVFLNNFLTDRGDNVPALDVSAFQNCTNMEDFTITRTGNLNEIQVVRNVSLMPSHIRVFKVIGFSILTSDLLALFRTHNSLTEVVLVQIGMEGSYGVTGSIFEQLLLGQNTCLASVQINGLNTEDPQERTVLESIFNDCGSDLVPENNAYVEMRREIKESSGTFGSWDVEINWTRFFF